MNFILGLYYLHEKDHAVTEKRCESLDKKIEGSDFSLNYARKLTTK